MTTKDGQELLYQGESYQIRGACFKIYKNFGGAFKESIINKSLIKELSLRGLGVENQKRIDIFYEGEKVGVYIPDIVVNSKIIIELKVKPFLTREDEKQFWHYLRGTNYKLGFLINFGSQKLEIRRYVYDQSRSKNPY